MIGAYSVAASWALVLLIVALIWFVGSAYLQGWREIREDDRWYEEQERRR